MIPGRIVTQVCNFFHSKNYISTFYVSIQSKGREEVEKKVSRSRWLMKCIKLIIFLRMIVNYESRCCIKNQKFPVSEAQI